MADILAAAADAATIVEDGQDAFMRNRLAQRAAKNIVSEIGEAATALPSDVTDRIPGVPWRAMKGIREKVVHDYPTVDLTILWDTLVSGIPGVAQHIRTYQDHEAT